MAAASKIPNFNEIYSWNYHTWKDYFTHSMYLLYSEYSIHVKSRDGIVRHIRAKHSEDHRLLRLCDFLEEMDETLWYPKVTKDLQSVDVLLTEEAALLLTLAGFGSQIYT